MEQEIVGVNHSVANGTLNGSTHGSTNGERTSELTCNPTLEWLRPTWSTPPRYGTTLLSSAHLNELRTLNPPPTTQVATSIQNSNNAPEQRQNENYNEATGNGDREEENANVGPLQEIN
jgi:hypothetical protein